MLRYFVAANFWLLIALTIFVGRTHERSGPQRYSFFGAGAWLSPVEYWGLLIIVLGVSATLGFRYERTRSRSDEQHPDP